MHRTPSFLAPDLPALVAGAELRLLLDHDAEILSTPRFFHAHAGAVGSGLHPDPLALDRPDGRIVAKFHSRVLTLPNGEAILEADYAVPLPMMWLAWQSMVDRPEVGS